MAKKIKIKNKTQLKMYEIDKGQIKNGHPSKEKIKYLLKKENG